MPHPKNAGYRKGDNWATCAVCGCDYRASEFRRRWDGVMVCREDWEPRHPQELRTSVREDTRPAVISGPKDVFEILPHFPGCVTITSPADGTVTPNATRMVITWEAEPLATFCHVRVFPLGDPMPEPFVTTDLTYTVEGLTPDTEYMVMVNAGNENGVGSTGLATSGQGRPNCGGNGVTTNTLACPGLLIPVDGSTVGEEDSTTLLWEEDDEAASYQVFVWLDGDPQPSEPLAVVTDTTYEVTGLDTGVTYRWVVNSVTAQGYVTSGCASSTFTTNPADAVIEWQSATFSGDLLAPSVTLTAVRSGNTTITASADYDFTEGTALIGPDFTATPGTVSFAAGEVVQDVAVPLVRDYDAEVLADTPWAYIKCNETSGTSFADSSGNSRNFTFSGTMGAYAQPTLNLSTSLAAYRGSSGLSVSLSRTFNGTNMPSMQNFTFCGWVKLDAANPTNPRVLFSIGGAHGSGQITKCLCYRNASGTVTMFWNARNPSGGASLSISKTFTTSLSLGSEFWFEAGQDCDNRQAFFSLNGGAREYQSWIASEDPWQIGPPIGTARETFLNIASSLSPGFTTTGVQGKWSQYEFYTSVVSPGRWPRWNLDASLTFTATLSNPSVDTTIGAIEETVMTMEAA